MADNPYSTPTRELRSAPGFLKVFTRCLPAAALAFVAIILCIAGIDLARGVAISGFIAAPGFLATLAALCIGIALVLQAAPLPQWARFFLTPMAAAAALIALIFLLNAVAR